MTISRAVRQYLQDKKIRFDFIEHRHTACSNETARASFIPANQLAKGVVLKNRDEYFLTVLPSSELADLKKVQKLIQRPVTMAREEEFAPLFPDCEPGAVPPIGGAYGLQAIVDPSLDDEEDVYFEAGDHCTLVHVSAEEFCKLMDVSPHNAICQDSKPQIIGVSTG